MTALTASDKVREWEIAIPRGPMICGYCGETEYFPGEAQKYLDLGHLELTGHHGLGVGSDGELVVLVEAAWLSGSPDHLPHLCKQIPAEVRGEYAADIAAILAKRKRTEEKP